MRKAAISKISVKELEKELRRRVRLLASLRKARNKLAAKLAKLDAQLAGLGRAAKAAAPRRAGRKRPRNKLSLTDTLAKVLDPKQPLSVGQAMDGVKRAGYKTTAKGFRVIVSQALTRDKRFKRASRGQYILKA